MKFTCAELPDIVIIEPAVYRDERGWFMETFNQRKFEDGLSGLGLPVPGLFVQDNQSLSEKSVLRGLHYQLEPFAQGKLVSVCRGAAFDVAVDIRAGSPTFGRWFGMELNEANKTMLWIPAGFAHGFLSLEDNTIFSYKTTQFYNRESERSICWSDPDIGIQWPMENGCTLNDKDQLAPLLKKADIS